MKIGSDCSTYVGIPGFAWYVNRAFGVRFSEVIKKHSVDWYDMTGAPNIAIIYPRQINLVGKALGFFGIR
ncbi:hypothetical protein Cyrtocomes_00575 [Candidatus Cyrtobacter comes]|uniref:Uncharacterized protein n=1 Tax=Candidatus Cyrtobacter comes TaxID=675776 RepID=A0ABU5L830_9RICK|nr:hypothetical protein [Candidatus Cyrtobacter comes]MDZ5762202.1 hypothetical protein [Candidatus Cyrtobacter comes]